MTLPFRTAPACDTKDAKGHAAGIVFIAPDGDILLLRRSGKEANFAGHWALPGGGVDDGETPEVAADREVGEEMGVRVKTPKKLLDQRRTPTGMVFHTFAQAVPEKFVPKLNDEHSGYAWAPLEMLPQPVHPAVKATLTERMGHAEDMNPADWYNMRQSFLKWMEEEASEPEHRWGADSCLALDRASIRSKSDEGHLHVALTPISKATVNPYRGSEIPDAEALGLNPDAIYYLLRDPEELAKAAATFNGKPLLAKHIPVSAEDHATGEVIGSTGTECIFEDPYLMNALVVWDGSAIGEIESETKKELSSGYRYRADMTPGNFRGMRYDGVMRDIVGNHVALVKDGRAGPDVVVGDSMENLKMAKPTRIAAVALRSTARVLTPLLAMDAAAVKLMPLFKDITTKNFKEKKPGIIAELKKVKLAKDANLESVVELLDALEGNRDAAQDEPVPEESMTTLEKESVAAPAPEFVSEDEATSKFKGFLKDCGMDDAKIEQAMSMMPKPDIGTAAQDEDDEAKKKAAQEEADKKKAEDEAKAKEDEDKKEKPMDKKAMDAAIDTAVTSAVAVERKTQQGIRMALDEVRPYVGEFAASMAFDSALSVFRKAAEVMGIKGAEDINEAGLRTIIKLQPKAGGREVERREPYAMDEASTSSFAKMFPGAERIQSV